MLLYRIAGDSITLPLTEKEKKEKSVFEICSTYANEASDPISKLIYPKNDRGERRKPIQYGYLPAEAVYLRHAETHERIETFDAKGREILLYEALRPSDDGERAGEDVNISEINFEAYVCVENMVSYCQTRVDGIKKFGERASINGIGFNPDWVDDEYENEIYEVDKVEQYLDMLEKDDAEAKLEKCDDIIYGIMKSQWHYNICPNDLRRETDFIFPTYLVENQDLVIKFLTYVLGRNNAYNGATASYHSLHEHPESDFYPSWYSEYPGHQLTTHISDAAFIEEVIAASDPDLFEYSISVGPFLQYCRPRRELAIAIRRVYTIHNDVNKAIHAQQEGPVSNTDDQDEQAYFYENIFMYPGMKLVVDEARNTDGSVDYAVRTQLPHHDPRVLKLCKLIISECRPLEDEHIELLLETFNFFGEEFEKQIALVLVDDITKVIPLNREWDTLGWSTWCKRNRVARALQEMVMRGDKLLECLEICEAHPAWKIYDEKPNVEDNDALNCGAVSKLFRDNLNKARDLDPYTVFPVHPS